MMINCVANDDDEWLCSQRTITNMKSSDQMMMDFLPMMMMNGYDDVQPTMNFFPNMTCVPMMMNCVDNDVDDE